MDFKFIFQVNCDALELKFCKIFTSIPKGLMKFENYGLKE